MKCLRKKITAAYEPYAINEIVDTIMVNARTKALDSCKIEDEFHLMDWIIMQMRECTFFHIFRELMMYPMTEENIYVMKFGIRRGENNKQF